MSARSTRIRCSWDDNASAWLDAVHGKRIESRRVATDAAMVEAVTALQARRVLDVGCGEGWLCRALAARGVHTVGIDACAAWLDCLAAAGFGHVHSRDVNHPRSGAPLSLLLRARL